jgi:hypothetical protein
MNSIQRQGLLLLPVNGVNTVFITFADFPELGGNSGWIFGYQLTGQPGSYSLSQTVVLNSTALGSGGGFWGSGAAPASDGTSVYTSTGNGTFDQNAPRTNYGDSLLRLNPSSQSSFWPPADFYTPWDVFSYEGYTPPPNSKPCSKLCECDEDVSSGGVLVVPSAYTYTCTGGGNNCPQCNGTACHVVINADKQSNIYVANQASLGGFNSNGGNNIEVVQTPCYGDPCAPRDVYQGYWASPAYWHDGTNGLDWLFYSATDATNTVAPFPVYGYQLASSGSGQPGTYSPVPQTANAYTFNSGGTVGFCQYSTTPSISSSGMSASTGIVWAIENPNTANSDGNGTTCDGGTIDHAVLHAFCATAVPGTACATALMELYNSTQNVKKTSIGKDVPFSTPTVFKGQVYMGTKTEVDVFGLCPSGGCPLQ